MSKIISFVLAGAFAFLLFVGMTILIQPNAMAKVDAESSPPISFTYNEVDDPPKIKKYPLPKKPEKPKTPQITRTKMDSNQTPDKIAFVDYKLPSITEGRQYVPPKNLMGFGSAGAPGPKVRINPRYPRDAAMNGIEGSVTLSFDISELGITENIRVVEANPRGVFNKAALKALRKWKYSPKIENDKAIKQQGQMVTLEFKLESEML